MSIIALVLQARHLLDDLLTDLQKGRRVEVKYADPGRRQVAEWVKVEITEP